MRLGCVQARGEDVTDLAQILLNVGTAFEQVRALRDAVFMCTIP